MDEGHPLVGCHRGGVVGKKDNPALSILGKGVNWRTLQFALLTWLSCCASGRGELLPIVCHVQEYTFDRWLISYEQYEAPLPDQRADGVSLEAALFANGVQHRLFYPRRALVLHPDPSSQTTLLLRSVLRLPTLQLDRMTSTMNAVPFGNNPIGNGVQFAWASGGLFYPSAFCVSGREAQGGTGTYASFSAPEPHTALLLALGAIFCRKRGRGA